MTDITQRLRDSADLLNRVAKDLIIIAKDLRPPITVESVQGLFSEEQLGVLKVSDEGEFVKVTLLKYLVGDKFADIAGRVKDVEGEWVSQGKESHFRIPKEAEK